VLPNFVSFVPFVVQFLYAMPDTQVLIVGAGPTGLNLALWLTRLGIRVRIIDKAAEPGTTSRALVVHARTLEFYRQLGFADEVVRRGVEFVAVNLWVKCQHAAHVELGKLGQGLSPFPFMTVFEQDAHERLLIDHVSRLGVAVERPTELIGAKEVEGHVEARLRLADGSEQTCTADYLAGCDGARSIVRHLIGAEFPGGTYLRLFYVADVAASGGMINHELHVALDEADLLAIFPLHDPGHARLIGTVRNEAADKPGGLTWDDVGTAAIDRLGVKVDKVNWFSTYHVHHRVANKFRQGRMFILGDAAHIHSPVGGQGMNTGIGDAVNLSWKLAHTVFPPSPFGRGAGGEGASSPPLPSGEGRGEGVLEAFLDSYEPERIAFARRLVETTDRAFTIASSPGEIARFVRTKIVPLVLPRIFGLDYTRRYMFRTVSQIGINYRHSPISKGDTGRLKSGDRLPWVQPTSSEPGAPDNFTPLQSLAWQVHIYGHRDPAIAKYCAEKNLPLHTFPWTTAAARTRLRENALYLIRPDGYIAFADPKPTIPALDGYLKSLR
jgi:2-polyprenyl-6-methoxyphenol hydroxylase-like FAD-dependent oxidoreductase